MIDAIVRLAMVALLLAWAWRHRERAGKESGK
jgi:hypothetical protein